MSGLWSRIFHKSTPAGVRCSAVVPAAGDGAGLEQTVRGLLWLRGDDLIDYVVVIADCGLDEEGRRMAEVLCRGSGQVRLCAAAQVEQILRERGGGRGP